MSISIDTAEIMDEINKFRFELKSGEVFWAPYLVNFNNSSDPNIPRGLGKSSPEEIKKSIDYVLSQFPSASGEEIRQKLIDGTLQDKEYNYKGIDCSGFVFYVMSGIYKKVLGKDLIDDLSIPRNNVLNGAYKFDDWKQAYELGESEAKALPDEVPVRWVVDTFKRKPVNLCNVAGLMSNYSSTNVAISSAAIGDLVNMAGRGEYKAHTGIICRIENSEMSIAHSTRNKPSVIGGVAIETLRRDEEKIYTEAMIVPHDFIAIRRLKSLAEASGVLFNNNPVS